MKKLVLASVLFLGLPVLGLSVLGLSQRAHGEGAGSVELSSAPVYVPPGSWVHCDLRNASRSETISGEFAILRSTPSGTDEISKGVLAKLAPNRAAGGGGPFPGGFAFCRATFHGNRNALRGSFAVYATPPGVLSVPRVVVPME